MRLIEALVAIGVAAFITKVFVVDAVRAYVAHARAHRDYKRNERAKWRVVTAPSAHRPNVITVRVVCDGEQGVFVGNVESASSTFTERLARLESQGEEIAANLNSRRAHTT